MVVGLRCGRGVRRWIKPRELAVEPAEETFGRVSGVGCASGGRVHCAERRTRGLFNTAIMPRHLELAEPLFHDAVKVGQVIGQPQ